uniref:Uncharacterized protein n=1 Tax=Nelumbo nucifera TaxID=4432 RepID=A0A822YQG6_NELNU|nr:TPA_asm: hypothetical protein HUJ06_005472 [Nelumbo nucifera]
MRSKQDPKVAYYTENHHSGHQIENL